MWAILGEIEFEVIGSPSGSEQRFAASFAEHARIAGKPRVEAVGGELDEIAWSILLHERLHDVEARLRALREATAAQQPLALVMGDGTYLGPWVITEGALTTQKTTASGRIVSAELQLTLREYTGEFTAPPPRPALAGMDANPAANPPVQLGLMTRTPQTPTAAQALIGAAKRAENALRRASDTLQGARQLPFVAAGQQVSAVVDALKQAARSVATLQQAGQRVAEAVTITALGTHLAARLQAMRDHLSDLQPATLGPQLVAAEQAGRSALQHLDQARGTLLKITADVAIRRR